MTDINSFSETGLHNYADVRVAEDYTINQDSLNWVKGNLYKRAITVDNTGLTVKTDYLICLVIDTQAWYSDNKVGWKCNDFRVYDSDGTTLLDYYIEAPNTTYTNLFVRIPSLAAASKTIYLEYGNPGLVDRSTLDTLHSVFQKDTLIAWQSTNEFMRDYDGGITTNLFGVHYWKNKANPFSSPIQKDTTKVPFFRENIQNGQPVLWAGTSGPTTGDEWLSAHGDHWLRLEDDTAFTVFNTSYANVTKQRYQSNTRLQLGSDYIVCPWWNGSDAVFIVSADGGTAGGISSGHVINEWNINSYHWNKNTVGNGMRTYRNGALVAQRTSANANIPEIKDYSIGVFSAGPTNFFSGYMGDQLIFNEDLGGPDRQGVEEYLNTKFAVYGTADMPSLTLGSETTLTVDQYSRLSYAGTAKVTHSDKMEGAIGSAAGGDTKVTITMDQRKIIATGGESWDTSTLVQNQKLSVPVCREVTASTSDNVDTVRIENIEGSDNTNDLSYHHKENPVTSTTYSINDADFITFEMNPEDASLIDTASSIEFVASGGSDKYTATLADNINDLFDNSINEVKIPMSEFTATGSPTWADVSYDLKVNIKTTSGTQTVYYGKFELVKNYAEDPNFARNNHADLNVSISDDSQSTFYTHPIVKGVWNNKTLDDYSMILKFDSYLDYIRRLRFRDLPSFPTTSVIFSLNREVTDGYVTDFDLEFYTYAIQKVLGFIFPHTRIDVDCDLLSGDGAQSFFNFAYFAIKEDDKIGDVLDMLLKACVGICVYDGVNDKIVVRSGYKVWDVTAAQLPTVYAIDNVLEYVTDQKDAGGIFNYISGDAIQANLNGYPSYFPLSPNVGFYGQGPELQPTTGDNTDTIFVDNEVVGLVDWVNTEQFYVDGYAFVADPVNPVINNTGIELTNYEIIGDRLLLSFKNTSGGTRYLLALGCGADSIKWRFINNWTGLTSRGRFTETQRNSDSITKFGREEYEIDPKVMAVSMGSSGADFPALYDNLVNQFDGDKPNIVYAKIVGDPNLYIGKYVSIRTEAGKLVNGYVIELTTYMDTYYEQFIGVRVCE